MITWDFYSKRRKTTLEKFLKGVSSYQQALVTFKEKQIDPPSNLKEFFEIFESKALLNEGTVKEEGFEKSKVSEETNKSEISKLPPEKKSNPSKKPAPSRRSSTKKQAQETVIPRDQLIEMIGQEKEETDKKDEKKPYFRKIIKPEKK